MFLTQKIRRKFLINLRRKAGALPGNPGRCAHRSVALGMCSLPSTLKPRGGEAFGARAASCCFVHFLGSSEELGSWLLIFQLERRDLSLRDQGLRDGSGPPSWLVVKPRQESLALTTPQQELVSQEVGGHCSSFTPAPHWLRDVAVARCWACGRPQKSQLFSCRREQQPPSLPSTSPPGQQHRATPRGQSRVGSHLRGSLSRWHPAPALPSRRGLLPALHSGPRPGSRSLFPFAQKNPSPRGSSQRRCAGKQGPPVLRMQQVGTLAWRGHQDPGGTGTDSKCPHLPTLQGSGHTISAPRALVFLKKKKRTNPLEAAGAHRIWTEEPFAGSLTRAKAHQSDARVQGEPAARPFPRVSRARETRGLLLQLI